MGLVKINNRGLPIPPVLQLLIRLRFYASASFQVVIGDTISVSQATISRIIFRVSSLIVRLISQIIKMPVTQERKTENYELFKRLGYYNGAIRLPGVDGAIDCTHIRLTHTISKHTKRRLNTRLIEHKNDINKRSGTPSIISAHRSEFDHVFDWDNVQVVDREGSYKKRLVSEMVNIKKQANL
ncbi:Putative nuclease HARBI1 [Ooceraea biroi]|uniref:Putative nuclease HARBI1 n=1 Tax=Ooceraea biroi TaxID=2015173 RepID=A0A026WHL0_OOCBI|nr:Putative nuclease HARBI1 [Ooceraea biroi]